MQSGASQYELLRSISIGCLPEIILRPFPPYQIANTVSLVRSRNLGALPPRAPRFVAAFPK
jgi:hypothetical protein